MGKLTTHVLDTAHGKPGAGIAVSLFRTVGETRELLGSFVTNADGRCDLPLLSGDHFVCGQYQLQFGLGDYFANLGLRLPEPRFLDLVSLQFGISDANAHYHVPLLASPFAYSTYRGS